MELWEDAKHMLHYKKIAEYVKKNKKDDMRTGVIYVAASTLVGAVMGWLAFLFNSWTSEMFGVSTYSETLAMLGWDDPATAVSVIAPSLIIGFLGMVFGLAVTHYISTMLGGKAKMGEYVYLGGKLLIFYTIISSAFNFFSMVPCLSCLTGILSILFIFYIAYLLVMLVSTLYKIDKLKAFVVVVVGYAVAVIAIYGILTVIGELTGLPMGLKMYEKMFEYYETMNYTAYQNVS